MKMQEITRSIVLTKPFSLRGDSDSEESYSAPNLLQRILSLLKNVRPGSDLTRFQASLISHPYFHGFIFFFFNLDEILLVYFVLGAKFTVLLFDLEKR
jgi:hypothetical protein